MPGFVHVIPWRPSEHGGPLGRHVEHDPRSRLFGIVTAPAAPRRPVLHRRHVPIFDQGVATTFRGARFAEGTGSCTGQALAGALSSGPNRHRFREPTALRLYARGSELDEVPGAFPVEDTGSTGLAVCKAAVELGYLSGYRHAFSLDEALAALQARPVIVGIAWRVGCDRPDSSGLVRWAGAVRGGHEVCAVGDDPTRRRVRFANSWGLWGDRGYFDLSYDDLAAALADDGDVTVPIA